MGCEAHASTCEVCGTRLVNHNRYPLPLFFVSVDSKQLSLPVSPLDATFMGGHISVASKEVIYSKMVQKEVCFASVADRGLTPKSRLQKAKTPARWLALSVSGTILPKKHYRLRLSFCQ
jgi:hypothetical protein